MGLFIALLIICYLMLLALIFILIEVYKWLIMC